MPSPLALERGSKPAAVEELLDTYFYRRLAAPLIPWLARWGLTPNQVTGLACLAGLLASASFWMGAFTAGGLLIIAAIVLDCSDGMLARHLGRSDPLGRILDGFADTLWVVCMYVAIWAGPNFASYDRAPLTWFMSLAGLSMTLHCGLYDGLKTKYLSRCEPGFSEKNLTRQEVVVRLKEAFTRRRYPLGLLYGLVWMHAGLFARKVEAVCPASDEGAREASKKALQRPMRLWSFLGESTHLTTIAGAALLTPVCPTAILWAYGIILGPLNLLWLVAGLSWRRQWSHVMR